MYKEITRDAPWILDFKEELPDYMKRAVVSPLHYGDTIEISFVRGIEGETHINGKRFEYTEKNVFFIPPQYLHTAVYRKGGAKAGSMVCAFHINLKALSPIINLKELLLKDNHTLLDFAFRCDGFEEMWDTVQLILAENRTFLEKTASLLHLFEIIAQQKSTASPVVEYSSIPARLVAFVEENYGGKLTIQRAAEHFGFSKQYFCKWFKKETGVTFNDFLNSVRIHHACSCLADGYSVEQTSERCGFADPSYFTKVFKRFVGTTPKAYTYK